MDLTILEAFKLVVDWARVSTPTSPTSPTSRCALSKRSQSLRWRPASPLSPTFGFWSSLLGSGNPRVGRGTEGPTKRLFVRLLKRSKKGLQHLQSAEGNGFAELFFFTGLQFEMVGQWWPTHQILRDSRVDMWWRPQGQELQSSSFMGNRSCFLDWFNKYIYIYLYIYMSRPCVFTNIHGILSSLH